jgi:hypothetical protein
MIHPTIIVDNSPGSSNNVLKQQPHDAEGYSGDMRDGVYAGKGTYVWPNGDRYVGEFRDGKRHGKCVYAFANGDLFNGKYKDDSKYGKGRYIYGKYFLIFKNDCYVLGIILNFTLSANGDVFDGTYLVS